MKDSTYSYENSMTRPRILQAAIALLLASALLAFLTSGRVELPQRGGNSLLMLISDDTRSVVSGVMLKKADEYFHGGLRVENCTHQSDATEAATLKEAGKYAEHDENEHDDANCSISGCAHEACRPVPFRQHRDPFMWINSQVHSQEHRHLEEARSVEMLPWVKAAVRASPHNIDAYESGAYILVRMIGKPQLAVDFLREGIKNNPDSPLLETTLGELLHNTIKDKKQAAVHFERALEKSLKQKGELNPDELFLRLKICFYGGLIARETHDAVKLRSAYEMARELKPDNAMTKSLAGWLAEEEIHNKE